MKCDQSKGSGIPAACWVQQNITGRKFSAVICQHEFLLEELCFNQKSWHRFPTLVSIGQVHPKEIQPQNDHYGQAKGTAAGDSRIPGSPEAQRSEQGVPNCDPSPSPMPSFASSFMISRVPPNYLFLLPEPLEFPYRRPLDGHLITKRWSIVLKLHLQLCSSLGSHVTWVAWSHGLGGC